MITYRYGLIGWPVAHSSSPVLQNAAFAAHSLAATYELLAVEPEKLSEAIDGLRQRQFSGFNVTVPHKEAVIKYLDDIDYEANIIGSVNTVLNKDGKLIGYSTDGYGLASALARNFKLSLSGLRVMFLGCGGAARASAVYFAVQGVSKLILVNRTLERAEALAESIRVLDNSCEVSTLALSDEQAISQAMSEVDVLIQSTSLGLQENDALPFSPELIPLELPIFDMIYGKNRFQELLLQRRQPFASGWDMLIYQGCKSFEIWTDLPAPEEAMRNALQAKNLF
jgi:shikimate dehydrogenase